MNRSERGAHVVTMKGVGCVFSLSMDMKVTVGTRVRHVSCWDVCL